RTSNAQSPIAPRSGQPGSEPCCPPSPRSHAAFHSPDLCSRTASALDTRDGTGGYPYPTVRQGTPVRLKVAGVGNVPAGVTAVALNLTEAIDLAVAGGPVSLIADIYGYFSSAPASSYMPVTPFRRLDTRKSAGAALPGGDAYLVAMDQGLGRLDPNAVLTGIVVNSTVTQTTASGYLTVFPD